MIFVKPKPGLLIRYPGQPVHVLPEQGAFVEPSPGWKRLIKDGDAIVSEPVSTKAKESTGSKN